MEQIRTVSPPHRTERDWDWGAGIESSARSYADRFPVAFRGAEGCELIAADGRRYLDLLCGAGVHVLGHAHPRIMAALRDVQAPLLSGLDLTTTDKLAFIDGLLGTLPADLRDDCRIQFCGPTGSDTVEAALKLARLATGRSGIFAFIGGYHGMTQGALGVSSARAVRRAGLRVRDDVTFCPFPYPFRGSGAWADPESAIDLALAHVEMLLADDHSGTDIPAAMLIEAVQGEGGNIVAPPRFLAGLRALCDRYGILLILDEIQSGVGRTGRWWAHQHANLRIDMMCVAKGVGGGVPVGVLVYRSALDVWQPGDHIGTFRGPLLAFILGRTTIEIIKEERLVERAARLGTTLSLELMEIVARHEAAGELRGLGLFLGVELTGRSGLGAGEAARRVQAGLFERGIIIERGGREGSVLRLLPPLNLPEAAVDRFLEGLDRELASL
jgi:diaminobutyrate-2-oxoglutarate transaminase